MSSTSNRFDMLIALTTGLSSAALTYLVLNSSPENIASLGAGSAMVCAIGLKAKSLVLKSRESNPFNRLIHIEPVPAQLAQLREMVATLSGQLPDALVNDILWAAKHIEESGRLEAEIDFDDDKETSGILAVERIVRLHLPASLSGVKLASKPELESLRLMAVDLVSTQTEALVGHLTELYSLKHDKRVALRRASSPNSQ